MTKPTIKSATKPGVKSATRSNIKTATRSTTQPGRTRQIIITIIIILLVAMITIFVFRLIYHHTENRENSPNQSNSNSIITTLDSISTSEEDSNLDNTNATESSKDTPSVTDDNNKPTATQYEGEDPNQDTSTPADVTLTYYGLQDGDFLVNISIAQFISGSCRLKLGNYSGDSIIEQGAASSACSFRIDPAKLSSGQQILIVDIASSERQGHLEEKIDVNL